MNDIRRNLRFGPDYDFQKSSLLMLNPLKTFTLNS